MFSSLKLFSQISCPSDEKCFLPNCLFLHKSTSEHPVGAGVSRSLKASDQGSILVPEAEESGSRKRRKLDPSPGEVTTRAASKGTEIAGHDKSHLNGSTTAALDHSTKCQAARDTRKSLLSSTIRPISPPPSRRALDVSTRSKSKLEGGKANSASLKPQEGNSAQATMSAVEILNPRMIPKPPASHTVRLKVVTKLYEEITRLNEELFKILEPSSTIPKPSEHDLIKMALDEEEKVAREQRLVYGNVLGNRLTAFKKMKVDDWRRLVLERWASKAGVGADAGKTGPVSPPPIVTGLTPAEELAVLPRLLAVSKGLSKLGYVLDPPTAAEIEQARKGIETAHGWESCDRCKTRFQVFPGRREDGALTTGGKCTYHHGKPFVPTKTPGAQGQVEKKYSCCNEPIGSSVGCTTAENHVFKAGEVKRMASVLQYERTPENPGAPSERAVCMDCEMCYTVYGLELVRLTATAWPSGDEILDVLVRPIGEILDLNTRFSGITAQQLADAQPYRSPSVSPKTSNGGSSADNPRTLSIVDSPSAARTLLFDQINPQTILIGHALENDLGATRVIHPSIVDSALLFPHRFGLPYRNSLKMLMSTYLGRDIQTATGSDVGHDSKEDARAAGELVRWAVSNEWKRLKRQGWTLSDGVLKSPESQSQTKLPRSSNDKKRKLEKVDQEAEEGEVVEAKR